MKWLCYCEGLRVERNFVCGFEQVLPDRSHRQLGVGFCDPEVACAVQAEEALHGAKMRVSREGGHRFHLILGTDFTRTRALISRERGH